MESIRYVGETPPGTRVCARREARRAHFKQARALTILAIFVSAASTAGERPNAVLQASGDAGQANLTKKEAPAHVAQPSPGAQYETAPTAVSATGMQPPALGEGGTASAARSADAPGAGANATRGSTSGSTERVDWAGLVVVWFTEVARMIPLLFTGLVRLIAIAAVGTATFLFARGALQIFTNLLGTQADPFSFRRHWGGFGGASSSGWYISPALIRLLVAVALAVGAVLMGLAALEAAFMPVEQSSRPAGAASEASAANVAHQ